MERTVLFHSFKRFFIRKISYSFNLVDYFVWLLEKKEFLKHLFLILDKKDTFQCQICVIEENRYKEFL